MNYQGHVYYRPPKRRNRRIVLLLVTVTLASGGSYLWRQKRTTPTPPTPNPVANVVAPTQQAIPPTSNQPSAPPPLIPDAVIPPIENELAPVISKIATKQPVVFLTIDDGAYKDPLEIELVKKHKLKTSLFLTYNVIRDNPDFFKDFIAAGSLVENHTMTHRILTKLSYEEQKAEICNQATKMEVLYGRRPVLFRPPGGYYNAATRRAAAACGMQAVVMWSAKANGGAMQYQVGNGLRAGDIVLMHFRPEFQHDLNSFIDAMNAAQLRTDVLENWLSR